jgi:hypothetical protein
MRRRSLRVPDKRSQVFYRMLRELGAFRDDAAERLRAFRTAGQLTPDELIGRLPAAMPSRLDG